MKNKVFLVLSALGVLVISGCGQQVTYPEVGPLKGDYVADFSQGESEEFFASNGWSNGQPFNAVWKKDNLTYSDGQMHLGIKDEEATDNGVTYPYTAGEARTHKLYGYGDFEVRMKPTNVPGSVSTFFVYTGQWDIVDGQPHKHDEVDIEFLGKDTTKVQFNYFVGGKGGHEHWHKLGFDASKEFHNYGFRWEEETISWLVDGKTVYQVKLDKKNPELPSTPGRIITNYWPCSAEGWSGKFKGATEDTVDYQWIKSNAKTMYCDGEEPVAPDPGQEELDWSKVEPTDLSFSTGQTNIYNISKEEGVTTVTYEEAYGWANVSTSIAEVANSNDTVNITIKNGSSSTSIVRVDVQGTTKVGDTDCLNVSGKAEGHSEIYTDKQWGGSKIELAAKEEVEFIISYDLTTGKGAATNLLVFVDSLQADPVAHAGGSISISNIKFAKAGTGGDPVNPPVPQPGEGDEVALTFTNDSGVYNLDPDTGAVNTVNVTYTDVGGASYKNFGAAIGSFVSQKSQFRVTMKNNGTANVKIRVDIQGLTEVGNTKDINTSASAPGHNEVNTDVEWGGSTITLAGNEEVEFTVNFNQATERGAANYLMFFIDSATYLDTGTYSGDVTLSHFIFA